MVFSRLCLNLLRPIPGRWGRRAPGRAFLAWALPALLLAASLAGAAPNPWTDVPEASIPAAGPRVIVPDLYRTVAIEVVSFQALLGSAPLEFTSGASTPLVLELPLPDGGSGRFAVLESPIMEAPLAALFPEIRTYVARGIDDPTATGRLDFTQFGFHAMIIGADGTFYIDPYQRNDIEHYLSYWKRDFSPRDKILEGCVVIDEDGMAEELERLMRENPLAAHGTELRTYRAAVATTGEYTAYYGGTVPGGLAGITTTMNRVTGIYERDVSVRMVLIANNNLIIYTNAATDPYTHGDAGAMYNQNQANLDTVIGSANYDIGHVCDTAGGGLAGLGVVCRTGSKARGVTGVYPPVGDPFDVDYVAHEMGHQYSANHSFNGNAGACLGNRVASKAYEPGSGSTIMSYAGICGSQNLQAHSDDYFIWANIDEIITYTTAGSGNTCPVITATGAVPPIVDAGVGGFTIPISTPFTLTGSAVTTGNPTYCWEESDLGAAGHPNTPSGNAPIFRSFDPVTTPSRTFPKQSDLLNNVHTIGELLPSYTRDLTFKLTVRDFQAGGVGVDKAGIAFQSTALAGPFLVTEPNTAVSWLGGTSEDVIWDVAGTDLAPVSCVSVNILLSTDGGVTWPVVVVEETPNDGTETIYVPNIATNTARIKVEAADNVFFDISNVNFTIEESAAVGEEAEALGGLVLHANQPNPFNPRTAIRLEMPQAATATLRVYDVAGRAVATLAEGRLEAGAHSFVWDGRAANGIEAASGVYVVELRALGELRRHQMVLLR